MSVLGDRLSGRARRTLSIAGYGLGLSLLGLAIWLAIQSGGQEARDALLEAPLWSVLLLALLAVLNALVVTVSFVVLTRAYGKVTLREMIALVGAAWLLNYLPMRPGLVGRVAYHKKYNDVRVRDSVRVLVIAGLATLIAAIHLTLLSLLLRYGSLGWSLGGSLASVGVIIGGVMLASTRAGVQAWRLWLTLVLRYIDILVWAGRYWAAGHVFGLTVDPVACLFLGSLSQVAFLVPFVGNGLGLREWTTGAAAGVVGLASVGVGVQLELVNRAAEVLVAIPIGLVCIVWLARRARAHEQESHSSASPNPSEG